MEYLRRYWWLAIALVLAIGAYAYFNRPPSPINASAANLMVSSEDLSGWPVDLQSTDNTFGSSDAARGVVHPGADADVYVMVYVFRSTTDSRSGYQQAITQVQNAGWTAPGAEGNPVFGDESFIGWSPAGSMVVLWRTENVIASASGRSERDADIIAIASEEADKINRAKGV